MRFLFDCGRFHDQQLAGIAIDGVQIDEYRLAGPADAAAPLSGPVRRRFLATAGCKHCVYLEDGRRVTDVID